MFKNDDRLRKENYRPISILNTFSKVFERYILEELTPFFNVTMSQFLSAYRKNFSCQNVLLRLIEQWRQHLDSNKVVGAILMDLSKAFDCLPHDLLIAKLEAYGLNREMVKLVYSYLKDRKQAVKVKGFVGILKSIISGVPQGSILGPILFNIFINDLFYFIEGSNLHNFADDNTLSDNANCIEELIIKLEGLSDNAIDWMDNNYMIANPAKFHAILLTKSRSNTAGKTLKIKNNLIQSESKVELLGLTIDNRLSFHSHISSICKKAAKQLNALKRLGSFLNFTQRKVLAQSFVLANFNYCPTIWHFCSAKDQHKTEKVQERRTTMQGRILYVGAKTDSNDLHRDIQNTEPYGTGLYERSYHPQSVKLFDQETFKSLRAKSESNDIWAAQLSLSGHLTVEQSAGRNQNSCKLEHF